MQAATSDQPHAATCWPVTPVGRGQRSLLVINPWGHSGVVLMCGNPGFLGGAGHRGHSWVRPGTPDPRRAGAEGVCRLGPPGRRAHHLLHLQHGRQEAGHRGKSPQRLAPCHRARAPVSTPLERRAGVPLAHSCTKPAVLRLWALGQH